MHLIGVQKEGELIVILRVSQQDSGCNFLKDPLIRETWIRHPANLLTLNTFTYKFWKKYIQWTYKRWLDFKLITICIHH